MADRFPYYDLDGRLVADAHEIAAIAAGHEEHMGRAYWTAFNALPHVRKAEGELLEAYVRGSTRHMLVKYSDPAGQESANIACQNRSEEHTSELQSLMRISYAVFCLKQKQ